MSRAPRTAVLAMAALAAAAVPARADEDFDRDLHWITAASFVLHVGEELPRFPAWATKRFGATSTPWFVYSHIPLVAAVVATSAWASDADARSTPVVLAMTTQWVLFTNGVFHLASTAVFDEYSPGVVTGTLIYFPATAYLFHRALETERITRGQTWAAIAAGTAISAAVVASLYLELDLDWSLRRRQRARAPVTLTVAPIRMPGSTVLGLGLAGAF